jgi:hypothetical protein
MECVLLSIVFVVIYIITVIINMYITHRECEPRVFTLGELIDNMEGWMFIPVVNTTALIILALCVCIYLIINYTGIIKLWNKIRNIKL